MATVIAAIALGVSLAALYAATRALMHARDAVEAVAELSDATARGFRALGGTDSALFELAKTQARRIDLIDHHTRTTGGVLGRSTSGSSGREVH